VDKRKQEIEKAIRKEIQKYEAVLDIGNITAAINPETGGVGLVGANTEILKRDDEYTIVRTSGDTWRLVRWDAEKDNYKIMDPIGTFEKKGEVLILTRDNKIIQWDAENRKGTVTIGDFTAENEEGKVFTLSADGKRLFTLDKETKEWEVTNIRSNPRTKAPFDAETGDGEFIRKDETGKDYFTFKKDGKRFAITEDGQTIKYDYGNHDFEVSKADFAISRAGKLYALKMGESEVAYDFDTGDWKLSDGELTLMQKGECFSLKKDTTLLEFDPTNDNGKITV